MSIIQAFENQMRVQKAVERVQFLENQKAGDVRWCVSEYDRQKQENYSTGGSDSYRKLLDRYR